MSGHINDANVEEHWEAALMPNVQLYLPESETDYGF